MRKVKCDQERRKRNEKIWFTFSRRNCSLGAAVNDRTTGGAGGQPGDSLLHFKTVFKGGKKNGESGLSCPWNDRTAGIHSQCACPYWRSSSRSSLPCL